MLNLKYLCLKDTSLRSTQITAQHVPLNLRRGGGGERGSCCAKQFSSCYFMLGAKAVKSIAKLNTPDQKVRVSNETIYISPAPTLIYRCSHIQCH